MPKDEIWIEDPETHEHRLVSYDELDEDILPQLWKPIGGFCYLADTFARLALTTPPFYLRNWLPKQGKMEVYGQPKAGKSRWAVQLARCIGAGVPFLGIETTAGRVLYLQFELGAEVLQCRMKETEQTYENVYVGTTFAMKLDTKGGQELLWKALAGVQPDVLILDPFYKIISGDENESHDVRVICDFLDDTIEAFKCSVVILHHPGKDISKGGRGSSVLEDWVDSYIEMKKVKDDDTLHIKLTPKLLRHAELPPEPIEAVLRNFEFEVVGAKPTVLQDVEHYLYGMRAYTQSPKKILEAGIGSHRSVYDALEVLQRRKVVNKVARGEYQWVGEVVND